MYIQCISTYIRIYKYLYTYIHVHVHTYINTYIPDKTMILLETIELKVLSIIGHHSGLKTFSTMLKVSPQEQKLVFPKLIVR